LKNRCLHLRNADIAAVNGDILGAIVDRVEVNDRQIRIVGRKDVLEQAVLAGGGRSRVFAVLFANGASYGSRTRLSD
jgi:hypothetical protein